MENIFKNTFFKLYKNGIKVNASKKHILYAQPIIKLNNHTLFWNKKNYMA